MGARCAGGRYFKVLCSPKILDVPPRAASRGCGSALVWPPSAFLGFGSAIQTRTDGCQRVYRVGALEFGGTRLFTDVGAFGRRFVPGQSTLGAGSWA